MVAIVLNVLVVQSCMVVLHDISKMDVTAGSRTPFLQFYLVNPLGVSVFPCINNLAVSSTEFLFVCLCTSIFCIYTVI